MFYLGQVTNKSLPAALRLHMEGVEYFLQGLQSPRHVLRDAQLVGHGVLHRVVLWSRKRGLKPCILLCFWKLYKDVKLSSSPRLSCSRVLTDISEGLETTMS